MADKEQFSSLFDMASKKQKKKEENLSRLEISHEVPADRVLTPQELQAEFERCTAMHKEIKEKIESAYEKAKISPRMLKEYYSTPTNFTAADWSRVQKEKAELQKRLQSLLPRSPESEMKPNEGDDQKQKTPKGFVSKKRWLSMH